MLCTAARHLTPPTCPVPLWDPTLPSWSNQIHTAPHSRLPESDPWGFPASGPTHSSTPQFLPLAKGLLTAQHPNTVLLSSLPRLWSLGPPQAVPLLPPALYCSTGSNYVPPGTGIDMDQCYLFSPKSVSHRPNSMKHLKVETNRSWFLPAAPHT